MLNGGRKAEATIKINVGWGKRIETVIQLCSQIRTEEDTGKLDFLPQRKSVWEIINANK